MLLALSMLMILGCDKEDQKVNTHVSQVKTFFSPENNHLIDLNKTSTVLFEWEQAHAADGGMVLYTLAFDTMDGDFSSPVYTLPSDENGLYNRATLTKEILNKIAKLAGLKPLESGQFKWTVFSSKGVNMVQADTFRVVTIKRALGIDNPPAQLYITGSATEGGTDLSKAVELKSLGNGKFEIYTSLQPGTYHFVDKITGDDVNTYFAKDGHIREGEGEITVTDSKTKVYHISLDFNIVSIKYQQIKGLGLWFAPDNKVIFQLTYDHNGIWRAKNELIEFKQQSWGRDERYKFRMEINENGTDSYIWWGSINSDNSRPDKSTPASFYYLYPVNGTQWDYCFKFRGECDMHHCDINFYLSPDKEAYTHEVIVKD